MKFLNDLHMDVPLAVLILLKKCIEFCLRMKAILKEGTLTSENGFLIVPKLWKKSIPSRNKSLARKLFTLINFIKFWVFCGTLKLMNCSFDLKNVVSESQISPKHEFLKVLSSVCDPLGVVSPTTDWFRCTTRTAVNNGWRHVWKYFASCFIKLFRKKIYSGAHLNNGWRHVWKYFASCFINSKNIVSKDLYAENKLGRCTTWKNNCLVGKYSWKCKR